MSIMELLESLPQTGEVVWIGTRPARKEPMISVTSVLASPDHGLDGDRYSREAGKRQVTLLQAEHLAVIAGCLGLEAVEPEVLRRNIVVSGINLLALKNRNIEIGNATLSVTGLCHPCSRMESLFGPGGYNAVRGHGGITAQVIGEGDINVGDSVRVSAP